VRVRNGGSENGLDIIDCIVSIFMFEITRATRTDSISNKDQLSYKVLHLF